MKLIDMLLSLLEAQRPSAYKKKGKSYAAEKAAQLDLTSHGNSIYYDRNNQPVAKSVNGGEDLVQIAGPDKIQNPEVKKKEHPRTKVDIAPFTVKEPEGENPTDGEVDSVDNMSKHSRTPPAILDKLKKAKKKQSPVAPDTKHGVQIGDPKEWKDMPPEEVVHNLYHMTGGSDLARAWVDQKIRQSSNKHEQERLHAWGDALDQIDTSHWPPSNKWHDMARTTIMKSGGDVNKARSWMEKTLNDYKTMKTKTTTDKAAKVDGILRFSRALKALDAIAAGQQYRTAVSFKNDPWYSLRYGHDRPDDVSHDAEVAASHGRPAPKGAPHGDDGDHGDYEGDEFGDPVEMSNDDSAEEKEARRFDADH